MQPVRQIARRSARLFAIGGVFYVVAAFAASESTPIGWRFHQHAAPWISGVRSSGPGATVCVVLPADAEPPPEAGGAAAAGEPGAPFVFLDGDADVPEGADAVWIHIRTRPWEGGPLLAATRRGTHVRLHPGGETDWPNRITGPEPRRRAGEIPTEELIAWLHPEPAKLAMIDYLDANWEHSAIGRKMSRERFPFEAFRETGEWAAEVASPSLSGWVANGVVLALGLWTLAAAWSVVRSVYAAASGIRSESRSGAPEAER